VTNPGESASVTNPGEVVPSQVVTSEAGTREVVPGEAASVANPGEVVPSQVVTSETGTREVVPGEAASVANPGEVVPSQVVPGEAGTETTTKQSIGGSSLLVEPEIIQTITPKIKSNPIVITSMKQLFNPTLVDMAFVNSNEYAVYIRCIPKLYEIGRESLNVLINKYVKSYLSIRSIINDLLNTVRHDVKNGDTAKEYTYYLSLLNKLRRKQHAKLQDIEYDVLKNTTKDENKQILQRIRLLIQKIYYISNCEYHLYNKHGTWTHLECKIIEDDKILALNLTSYTAQHPEQDYFDYLINEYVYYKQSQCIYFVNSNAFTDLLYDRLDDECNKLYSMGISDYYKKNIDPTSVAGNLKSAESRPVTNVPLAVTTHSNSPIPAESSPVTNVPLAVTTHSNSHIAIPAESTAVIAAKDESVTKNPTTKSGDTRSFSINNLPENMPPARSTLYSMNEESPSIDKKITLEKSKYADPTPESQEWYNLLLKTVDIQKTENIDLSNIVGILNNIVKHMNTKKELPDSLVSLLLDYVQIINIDSELLKEWESMIISLVFKPETDTTDFNKSVDEIIKDLRTDVKVDAIMKQHIEKYIIEQLNFPSSKYNVVIQLFRNIQIDSDLTNIKDAIILAVA
jgi:hypothetical protein